MAGLENELFSILGERSNYDDYREHIPEEILSPVGRRFLKYLDNYWERYSYTDAVLWDDFNSWLKTTAAPHDTHLDAMVQLGEITRDVSVEDKARDVLNRAVERDISEQIQGHLESEDGVDVTAINDLLHKLERFKSSDLEESNKYEVSTDIEEVLKSSHITDEGLEFSLDILKESIGPLRAGDTVYIPARPEVGKTTFLCHQAGHMIENSHDTTGIIFSNEEDGNRVMIRLYQSILNWTTKDILADPSAAKREYERQMGGLDRIRIIHAAGLHRRDCERVIEKAEPNLIVFNMLSKIGGFGSSRMQNDVDVYSAQGIWMRELANSYNCAAMTAWQAGGSAHGKAWIEQDDMYGSKTGIVAEADVILGIGKVIEPSVAENHRYIHLSKNKLPGDSKTDERKRHGYFNEIYIDAERGRFYE